MAAACRLPQVCFHQVVSAISYPLVPSVIFCLCVNDFSIHFLFHIVFFLLPPPPYPYSYSYSILGYSFLSVLLFFFFWARELCNLASSCGRSKRKYAGSASVSIPVSGQDIYIYILPKSVCLHENSIKIARNGSGRWGRRSGSNTEVVRSLSVFRFQVCVRVRVPENSSENSQASASS